MNTVGNAWSISPPIPTSDVHTVVGNKETAEARNHRIAVRWWIFTCLSLLIISPILSILLGLNLHARDFQYLDESTFSGRTVLMQLVLFRADPDIGTMTMDWDIIGESHSNCSSTNLEACSDVNIFFGSNLLRNSDQASLRTNSRPTQPIFQFNATAFALNDIFSGTPSFRTDLALFSAGDRTSLLYYPFDKYLAEIFTFAQDANTNETVGLKLAETHGIAVGFKTDAITRPDVTIPDGVLDILITVSRGNLFKAYAIVASVAIWLITLVLLLVMITAVFFNFRQKGEVLLIPVATLFAFTQLRQSMPGAPPGFGDIVDFVGILPCLALLSFSASITLGAFILSDPTHHPQRLGWDLWYQAFPNLRPQDDKQTYLQTDRETQGGGGTRVPNQGEGAPASHRKNNYDIGYF